MWKVRRTFGSWIGPWRTCESGMGGSNDQSSASVSCCYGRFIKGQNLLRSSALEDVKAILVLEEGLLGDMVMLAPFLRSLRSRFPDAHLAILGRENLTGLVLQQGFCGRNGLLIRLPWYAKRISPYWRRYNPLSPSFWFRFVREHALRFAKGDLILAFAAEMSDLRQYPNSLAFGLQAARGLWLRGRRILLTDVVVPDPQRPYILASYPAVCSSTLIFLWWRALLCSPRLGGSP